MYTGVCVYTCISRERETDRHMYIYIYTYIYIYSQSCTVIAKSTKSIVKYRYCSSTPAVFLPSMRKT